MGKGRAALLLSDQIWLWSRGHQGGGPQAELLRRIAHWLMKEPELEENALTARVADGRLTIERRSTDPAPPGAGDGDRPGRQDADRRRWPQTGPGRATADLPAPTPGVWQVSDGARTAYAAAGAANPPEIADLRATATLLRKLARASGGGVHWLGTGAPARRRSAGAAPHRAGPRGVRQFAGSGWQRRHDHVVTGIAALALLPPWLALPLMLGLMVLAWRREGP